MEKFNRIFENFLEIIYPSNIYCICCGNIIDKTRPYSLCDGCLSRFRWAGSKTCVKCGKLLEENYRNVLCRQCMETPYDFLKGFACVQYGMNEKVPILALKYAGQAYIGRKLGDAMYDRFMWEPEAAEIELVVPVPMHKAKQRKRGYNQAAIMAGRVARKMKVPLCDDLLARWKKTTPMSGLAAEQRRANVEGSFQIMPSRMNKLQGKTILLIDDIFTTGSTAQECSRVLIDSGASKVYLLVFAAGANVKSAADADNAD